MSKDRKAAQLGMNPSTASGRLVKDVLWKLIGQIQQDYCCKCGEAMSRENFSIEHVIPWLDSEDPVGLYFDLENISFSHLTCNVKARRDFRVISHGTEHMYDNHGCRCEPCVAAKSAKRKIRYTKEKRRERYQATGH